MKRKSILMLLITAGVLVGCGSQTIETNTVMELAETSTDKPQTIVVERGDLRASTSFDAQVGPRVLQLTFADEGIFGEYKVGLGDSVKKGDILAVSDSEYIEDQIEEYEKELDNYIYNYNYQKASYENDIKILQYQMQDVYDEIAEIEDEEYGTPWYTQLNIQIDNYEEDIKLLELQLTHLQEDYDLKVPYYRSQIQKLHRKSSNNVIKAPFDGTIVALHEVDGKGIEINENLYYIAIADNSTLYARCDYVSPSIINSTQQIVFWHDGVEYSADYVPMTEKIYREMKNSGEDMFSEFQLQNEDGTIVSGDYGKIKLVTKDINQVLLIPEFVVRADADGYYVYRDNAGTRERVSVELGSTDGLKVEIVNGLKEGDVIYVQE